MALVRVIRNGILCLVLAALFSGCSSTITKPNPAKWQLPHKEDAKSGMIIGRLDVPANKTENPEGLTLLLGNVMLSDLGKSVHFGPELQDPDIMSNNVFVFSNVKPGKYKMIAFYAGVNHGLYGESGFTVDVKPGQIKFLGSYDYIEHERTFFQRMRKTGTFGLRKATHPTELEIFQWLNSIGQGSGWEPAIRERILELGGHS